jgi:hypothetical protein
VYLALLIVIARRRRKEDGKDLDNNIFGKARNEITGERGYRLWIH